MLIALGWLVRIFSFAAIPYLVEQDWSALTLVPPLVLSAVLVRWGKMRRAPSAETILEDDPRPPVVFLRSFQDEEHDQGVSGVASSVRVADRTLSSSVTAWGPREQEAFASLLRKVGPYVAIGRPGEKFAEVGAARMYVADDQWQTRVRSLCARATLIIVRAGATNGLQWEVEQLVALGSPLKLLVLLPPTPGGYARFCEWANRVLPVALPAEATAGRLLIFDEGWRPRILPAETTLTKSLQPYFRQNALDIRESAWEAFMEHNGLRS